MDALFLSLIIKHKIMQYSDYMRQYQDQKEREAQLVKMYGQQPKAVKLPAEKEDSLLAIICGMAFVVFILIAALWV